MFKGTSVKRRNLEVKMEGQDAKERGVYKKKMVFKEGGLRHKHQKRKRNKKRVNSATFYITLASSGRLVGRHCSSIL